MAKKLQITISNLRKYDEKKLESILKTEFNNEYKNLFHQKDKRNNLTLFFTIKNDVILLHKFKEFFAKTMWKLNHD